MVLAGGNGELSPAAAQLHVSELRRSGFGNKGFSGPGLCASHGRGSSGSGEKVCSCQGPNGALSRTQALVTPRGPLASAHSPIPWPPLSSITEAFPEPQQKASEDMNGKDISGNKLVLVTD